MRFLAKLAYRRVLCVAMTVFAMASGAVAQNERLFLFRNDNAFNEFKIKDISGIDYRSDSEGRFTDLAVTTADGTKLQLPMLCLDSAVVRQTAIPDIYVRLTDYPEIPDLFKGEGFSKSTVYDATLRIDGNGMFSDLPEQKVEFRGRGNSTWLYPKTPYRFKMAKKASACGLPKAKSFALIANYIDPSLMRNTVALSVALEMGMAFSNHSVPCNVYLNGHYRGCYMLTEKIGIGGGSVDIEEDTGMLFELDANYDEDYRFIYAFGEDFTLPVMVKDPDLEEIKPDKAEREAYFSLWKDDFAKMVDALLEPAGKRLSDYVDLASAARFVLVNSVAFNRELLHPKSVFIYKESLDANARYFFGPVWDFDWGFGYNETSEPGNVERVIFSGDASYSGGTFFGLLASDSEFREVYEREWKRFYDEVYPRILALIDSYSYAIEPSAKRDGLLWNKGSYETRESVAALRNIFIKRVEYCNTHPNFGLYK